MPQFNKKDAKTALKALLEAVYSAGTQQKLAEAVGVTQQSVSDWLKRGYAPAEQCRKIEAFCGIQCEDLRPDIFKAHNGNTKKTNNVRG